MDGFRNDVKKAMGTAAPKSKLYRVQVGAFSVKANAEKLAKEPQSKGYSTIIKEE
jgi:cell division septation protein DedD